MKIISFAAFLLAGWLGSCALPPLEDHQSLRSGEECPMLDRVLQLDMPEISKVKNSGANLFAQLKSGNQVDYYMADGLIDGDRRYRWKKMPESEWGDRLVEQGGAADTLDVAVIASRKIHVSTNGSDYDVDLDEGTHVRTAGAVE